MIPFLAQQTQPLFIPFIAILLFTPSIATPSVISHHSHLNHPKLECLGNPVPHLGPSSFQNVETSNSFSIFPNFPFGYYLNPISSTGFEQLGAFEAVEANGKTQMAKTIHHMKALIECLKKA
ncbi:hypothetical protein L3X38_009057 [Prunus dulcis]|uniref:Transmembrane protein n=1 Tax=Prunus dulcis TaxID=3755 RepID=A0AAD5F7H2_PRUDU|nr:hypothetical protein L3X38_009057 [Prunus dulcis]